MISSGRTRTRTRTANGEAHNSFQLIERFTHPARDGNVFRDDTSAEFDDSSLRHHSFEDKDVEGCENQSARRGLFQRLVAFMSLTPLLGGSARNGNSITYGALSNQGSESSSDGLLSEDFAETDGNASNSKGSERADQNAALRAVSSARSHFQLSRNESTSSSRNTSDRANLGMLNIEPDFVTVHEDHVGEDRPALMSDVSEDEEDAVSVGEGEIVDPPDNSPYPQVRASVAATDDISLSISTPRMWTLSILCAFVGSATNLFFSLRYPSVAITPVIALVVVHPLGLLWDRLLKRKDDPAEAFENGVLKTRTKSVLAASIPSNRTRLRLWLAQGEWNAKEHACVYVSSNVSFGFAFATDVIVEQSKFYHQDLSIIYQLLLTISTQILGYAFAGLTRRFLVRPPSMIWPGTLMSTAMFTTMHSSENKSAHGWTVSRWKFFLIVWSGAFAWYFLPGLLMPALSYFSVITWFVPKNVVVANLVCLL